MATRQVKTQRPKLDSLPKAMLGFADGGIIDPALTQGERAGQAIMADLNGLGKVAAQPGQGEGASYNWATKSAAEIAAASGVNPNAAYVPGHVGDPKATASFGVGRAGSVGNNFAVAPFSGVTQARPQQQGRVTPTDTLPAATTFQQDINARQSRITAYADKLKAMETNGRAASLMGSSATITRGFADGGELGVGAKMAALGITGDSGGIIRGPGTPTSDSVSAQVRETGEQIKVSTDERVVSKAQNDLLDAVAKASGYDSLDHLFEGFGLPVGPTIKGGKRHAATGMAPVSEDEQRTAAAIAAPPTLGSAPFARSEPSGGALTNAALAGRGITERGIETEQKGTGTTYRPEVNGITWNAKGFDPTQEKMAPGTGAIAITSGPNSGKNIVVGPQNYVAADGSQTSDWSKTAQYRQGLDTARRDRESLATMQRDRLERDAFDPTITDPNVRAGARAQIAEQDALAGKAGEAQGRMLENEIKRTKLASDSAMAGLQGQYLSEQDPTRRNEIAARISALQGKGATAPSLQHVETENGVMAFDPRTGTMTPAMSADGQAIKGSKPLTEFQGKSTSFGLRADAASRIIDTVGKNGEVQPSLTKRAADAVPLIGSGLGMLANQFQTPEQQQVEQAQRDFINSVLRQESGAAISASEFDNARKQYFPQPGDSAQVIAQKKANREMAINGFRISAGPGAKNIGGAPQQAQPAAGPQVGAVDGGHVYIGGDPGNPASWKAVQK